MGIKSFLAGCVAGAVTGGVIVGAVVVEMMAESLVEEIRKAKAPKKEKVKEGDYVNWESEGVLRFKVPRKVLRIEESDVYGDYVFVEGSKTGIPIGECVKVC